MKLILFNGPPGVGKTTLAKKVHDVIPLSFLLDLDLQKEFISHHNEYRKESGILSFDIALATAEACFKRGRDFISGKGMLNIVEGERKKNVLDLFIELGHKYKAEVYEIFLWADKQTTLKRADNRGYKKKLKGTIKNTKKLNDRYWEELNTFKDIRTNAIIVDTSNLSPEEVFDKIKSIVKL